MLSPYGTLPRVCSWDISLRTATATAIATVGVRVTPLPSAHPRHPTPRTIITSTSLWLSSRLVPAFPQQNSLQIILIERFHRTRLEKPQQDAQRETLRGFRSGQGEIYLDPLQALRTLSMRPPVPYRIKYTIETTAPISRRGTLRKTSDHTAQLSTISRTTAGIKVYSLFSSLWFFILKL